MAEDGVTSNLAQLGICFPRRALIGVNWAKATSRTLGVVLCLLAGALISVWLGQDANWDLGNYHLYNAYSILHDRGSRDFAAVGIQSWLNPVLDLPYSYLALGPLYHYPRILAAIMGLWYGALLAVVLALSVRVYGDLPVKSRWIAVAAAAVLGSTGAATFSQAGTTFNEIQTGTLVLAAVFLLLRDIDIDHSETAHSGRSSFIAGLMLGAAVGLKFNSAIYGPAACVAVLIATRKGRTVRRLVLIAGGGFVGFLITGGWWAYELYTTFQNPFFPFFNDIFRSTWFPSANLFDRRFLPHSVWQAAFYPLFWLGDHGGLVTEPPFTDGRVATAYVSLVALGAFQVVRTIRHAFIGPTEAHPQPALKHSHRFLISFTVSSYVGWICTTSILRYAIPIEVTAAASIPLLAWRLLRVDALGLRQRTWVALICLLAGGLILSTRYPDWGRANYGQTVLTVDMKWLPKHSLIIFLGAPVAYVAPFVPRNINARILGLQDAVFESRGFGLANEFERRLSEHSGPIVVIWASSGNWMLPSLPEMGLDRIVSSCRTFFSSFVAVRDDHRLNACFVRREGSSQLRDPFWRLAAARYSEIWVPGPAPGWSYVGFVDAVGKLAKGKRFVDKFEFLWSREPTRPKEFDDRILPDTLYVLNPSLRSRALAAMNPSTDLLTTVDGVLVLAPHWKSTHPPCGAARSCSSSSP